jgi:hypothetical protein
MQNSAETGSFRYEYDIFISYKSQQESWARRLAQTLREFGLKVWRDHDAGSGIRIAHEWSEEIRIGIKSSRVMLVLWSELVANDASSYILDEVREMDSLIESDRTGQRRFLPVRLDGASIDRFKTLAPYHADSSFRNLFARYGESGGEQVDAIGWYSAVKPLAEELGITGLMEARYVVAAMDRTQAEQLIEQPEKYAQDPHTFKLMHDLINKTSGSFNLNHYGSSPDDWRPFPQLSNQLTIRELIANHDSDKRRWLQEQDIPARWVLASYSIDIMSADIAIRNAARDRLKEGPFLVLMDPVSLMHRAVYDRILLQGGLQHHPHAHMIGFAPFVSHMHPDLWESANEVDQRLQEHLAPAYSRFTAYFAPGNEACVLHVDHEHQFVRWLQLAVESIVATQKTPLRAGRAHPDQVARLRPLARARPSASLARMGGQARAIP